MHVGKLLRLWRFFIHDAFRFCGTFGVFFIRRSNSTLENFDKLFLHFVAVLLVALARRCASDWVSRCFFFHVITFIITVIATFSFALRTRHLCFFTGLAVTRRFFFLLLVQHRHVFVIDVAIVVFVEMLLLCWGQLLLGHFEICLPNFFHGF